MILYLDPWSGISGDMLLAALLDTDRDDGRLEEELRAAVAALGVAGAGVEVSRDVEWGVACTRVRVKDDGGAPASPSGRHGEHHRAAASVGAGPRTRRSPRYGGWPRSRPRSTGARVEEIHFHEVGAVDTLVDVVGTFALVDALGIDR